MRVSRVRSQETAKRIVALALALFSRFGFQGVGLATIMKASGLTIGGFYKHFESKNDLIVQATKLGFQADLEHWRSVVAQENSDQLEALVDHYLLTAAGDNPSQDCPLTCLAGDAARAPGLVGDVFADGIRSYAACLDAAILHAREGRSAGDGLQMLAQLVGAATLSRSVRHASPELARRILSASRTALLCRIEPPSGSPSRKHRPTDT